MTICIGERSWIITIRITIRIIIRTVNRHPVRDRLSISHRTLISSGISPRISPYTRDRASLYIRARVSPHTRDRLSRYIRVHIRVRMLPVPGTMISTVTPTAIRMPIIISVPSSPVIPHKTALIQDRI